jgi:hypothetical protein
LCGQTALLLLAANLGHEDDAAERKDKRYMARIDPIRTPIP